MFYDDISSVVKEIVISAPFIKNGYLRKVSETVSEDINLKIITSEPDGTEEYPNIEFVVKDKIQQIFTVLDKQVVWYGNINPLSNNKADSSAIRLLSVFNAKTFSLKTKK